jgi:hypothetical protein
MTSREQFLAEVELQAQHIQRGMNRLRLDSRPPTDQDTVN